MIDTAVLALALGGNHPLREACRAIVADAAAGRIELHASTELVQELVFHRMRRVDRRVAVREGRDVLALCVLHPLDQAVLGRALDLIETSPLRGRDAVHAATALVHGFATIITPDRDFDDVPGLVRVDPASFPRA